LAGFLEVEVRKNTPDKLTRPVSRPVMNALLSERYEILRNGED
jgi:hypothetical protein